MWYALSLPRDEAGFEDEGKLGEPTYGHRQQDEVIFSEQARKGGHNPNGIVSVRPRLHAPAPL